MNYKKNEKVCPILIKGVLNRKQNLFFQIESLQERIQRGLLNVIYLSKIMFHVTILVWECDRRKPNFLKSLSIDKIYLNKNDEQDANVFIFEEDQQSNTNQKLTPQQILFKLSQTLGFNLKNEIFKEKDFIQDIISQLYQFIFQEIRNDSQITITDKMILTGLYNIKILKTIYNKTQSRVYLIEKPYFINSERNQIVVKWVKYSNQEEIKNYLDREIKLLEMVNDSENCTKMFCYNNIYDQQFIFMKFYHATLEDLNNNIGKAKLDIIQLLHLIKQMLLALKGLHSRNIIHRDLKPQNIMFEYLNENKNIQEMRCVLIDFDRSDQVLTSFRSNLNLQSDYQGTPDYQPPEGTQEYYDPSYDIWQLGYIIQCILLRDKNKAYSRLKDRPKEDAYNNIFTSDHKKVEELYPQFYELIKEMMDYHPEKRPNLEYIEKVIQNIK